MFEMIGAKGIATTTAEAAVGNSVIPLVWVVKFGSRYIFKGVSLPFMQADAELCAQVQELLYYSSHTVQMILDARWPNFVSSQLILALLVSQPVGFFDMFNLLFSLERSCVGPQHYLVHRGMNLHIPRLLISACIEIGDSHLEHRPPDCLQMSREDPRLPTHKCHQPTCSTPAPISRATHLAQLPSASHLPRPDGTSYMLSDIVPPRFMRHAKAR